VYKLDQLHSEKTLQRQVYMRMQTVYITEHRMTTKLCAVTILNTSGTLVL